MSEISLPAGWVERCLDEIVAVDLENLPEDTPSTYRFKYISLSDVNCGRISPNVEELTFAQAPSRARRVLHDNDVLLATVRPNLQGFALLRTGIKGMVASTGFAVLTDNGVASTEYIYHYLYCDHTARQINNLVAGSTAVSQITPH